MIWLILGFFLQAWTCLLFFALFEYKPAWVQHEGPSLVILFYIGHRSAYSIRWIRPTQQCVHKVCTKSAQVCAGRVRGIVAKVCILQNNCHSPASPPTFALSAAIQMWTGKNIPEYFAKEEKMLEDEMQRRSVAVWAAG